MTVRDQLDNAIYNALAAGTALISELGGSAIYNTSAHKWSTADGVWKSVTLPYVVYQHIAGGPETDNAGNMYSQLYTVRAFANTQVKVRAIEEKFDALLHKQTLTVTGYTNFWTVRESDLPSTVENLANGEKVYSSGGYYRIRLDA